MSLFQFIIPKMVRRNRIIRSASERAGLEQIIFLILLPFALLTQGCSLVTIESQADPFSRREMNTLFRTHEFVTHFAVVVEEAADSILAESSDWEIQVNALRWKIQAISALRRAGFQTVPTSGLIDTWTFCIQMRRYFQEGKGEGIFKEWQHLAVDASVQLESDITDVAREMLTDDTFKNYRIFVTGYADAHPLEDITLHRESSLPEFREYLGIPDSAAISTVGTLPQVMSDIISRSMIYGEQVPTMSGWRAELFMKDSGLDTLKVREHLDSLGILLERYATIAENSPGLIDSSLQNLSIHLMPLIQAIDKQRIETLEALSLERAAVTEAVRRGRIEVTADVERISKDLLEQSLTHLRKIINRVLFFALLIAIVVLGLPFTLGVIVGRTIQKKS